MITALHAIRELTEYAREKAKEIEAKIQEEEEEEEPDYEELYIEALRDKTVRKIMANYREGRTKEEKTQATICSIITMIETIILILFIC